jgi:hypothetical protein
MSRFVACLVLAVAAGPVAACINDAELPNSEREFRSQYRDPAATPKPSPTASPEPAGQPSVRLLVGGGAVLAAAALALTLTSRRAKG